MRGGVCGASAGRTHLGKADSQALPLFTDPSAVGRIRWFTMNSMCSSCSRLRTLALVPVLVTFTAVNSGFAQRSLSGIAQVRLALAKLNVLGSVLMIAAHPDDENT